MILAQKQTYSSMEQNREQEIRPNTYGQFIYNKRGKNIQWRKDSLFSKWCWESWTASCKSMKLEHSFTPYTKINSKWFKDLNIRHDTINSQKRTQVKLLGHKSQQYFLKSVYQGKEIKAKINKLDLTKHKSCCTAKETTNKMKDNLQNGRKYLQTK